MVQEHNEQSKKKQIQFNKRIDAITKVDVDGDVFKGQNPLIYVDK